MKSDAINGRNTDRARNNIFNLLQLMVQGIIGLDDLLAELVEDFAFAGQPELLFASFNKQGFKSAFKRTNLLTDSRLRDLVDLRCFGKTLRFCKVTKDLQTLNLHWL